MNAILKTSLLASAIAMGLGLSACGHAGANGEDAARTEARAEANAEQPRSVGTAIDDASITASVKTQLLEDDRTDGFDVNVDTRRGVVTLEGGADSLAAKLAATEIAAGVTGVVDVDNQLTIADKGSEARQDANTATASGEVRELADETGDAIDDAWITTKVKSKLLADGDVEGFKIDVTTKGNVVYLSGVVEAAWIRDEAIRLAQNTRGVRGVEADGLRVN